ncbi:MAG: hypothetical protein CSA22_08970 [Deltaproteobacteria bacterium]|nr:MAG: hypothetical protein CSA22_08970 [Deltaproteobacteria bacterium]
MNVNPTHVSTAARNAAADRSGAAEQAQRPHLILQKGSPEAAEAADASSALGPNDVEEIVEALNDNMDDLQTSLGFELNDDINEVIVTVMNRDTQEVIRQIPAKELVTIREKMAELTGVLLNKLI